MQRTTIMTTNSEIVGIMRALGYLAHEARTSGMPDVADYIVDALHNSGDWALQTFSQSLKEADDNDRLAVIQLISRFMSASDTTRSDFLRKFETDRDEQPT